MIFSLALCSCTTVREARQSNAAEFPDPQPQGSNTAVLDNGDVLITDKYGALIMRYSREADTVTMAHWYWKKVLRYAIDMGATIAE